MKHVKFYKLQNDGGQKIIAICRLDETGRAVCEGEKIFCENLGRDGILDYSAENRAKLFLGDGLKFLEQLKFNFTSGYLNASDILEE